MAPCPDINTEPKELKPHLVDNLYFLKGLWGCDWCFSNRSVLNSTETRIIRVLNWANEYETTTVVSIGNCNQDITSLYPLRYLYTTNIIQITMMCIEYIVNSLWDQIKLISLDASDRVNWRDT